MKKSSLKEQDKAHRGTVVQTEITNLKDTNQRIMYEISMLQERDHAMMKKIPSLKDQDQGQKEMVQTEIKNSNDMREHAMRSEITLLKESFKNEIVSLKEHALFMIIVVLQERENDLKNEITVLKENGMSYKQNKDQENGFLEEYESKGLEEGVQSLKVDDTVPDSPVRQCTEYNLRMDGNNSSEDETWQMM